MTITHFRQLRVYQQGYAAAMQIFELTTSWPKDERYGLISQIPNSSRSVCSNIAEGWSKRRYVAHFTSMTEPDKWCGPANMVREERVEYRVAEDAADSPSSTRPFVHSSNQI